MTERDETAYIEIIAGQPIFASPDSPLFGYMLEGFGDKVLGFVRMGCESAEDLIQRCRRTWNKDEPIFLKFVDRMGVQHQTPIRAIKRGDNTEMFETLMIFVAFDAYEEFLGDLNWEVPPPHIQDPFDEGHDDFLV